MSMRRTSLLLLFLAMPAFAQAPLTLRESNTEQRIFAVAAKVEVVGTLTLTAEQRTTKTIGINGQSDIAYDEKPLPPLADGTWRSVRAYRQVHVRRTINSQPQEATIRPGVRRMVILRSGTREVPFSPDGPLTYSEIDLVRTDVTMPALAGFLPTRAVKPGDAWSAAASAVEEITDLERVEQGGLECRFVGVEGRTAKVTFAGTVTGVNEDGPVRQQLDGHLLFDLDLEAITGLSLTGVKSLMDGQGKVTGRVEGKFAVTRSVIRSSPGLSHEQLSQVTLEPNLANTQLCYEAAGANIYFTYPRRWRLVSEQGRQITLDGPPGNGLLITVEPPDKVPTAAAYVQEAENYVAQQKGRVLKSDPPQKLRPFPLEVERFGLDIELKLQRASMIYLVVRQQSGGATLAGRLQPADAATLRPEIEQIAKSIQIRPAAPAGVVPLPGK